MGGAHRETQCPIRDQIRFTCVLPANDMLKCELGKVDRPHSVTVPGVLCTGVACYGQIWKKQKKNQMIIEYCHLNYLNFKYFC